MQVLREPDLTEDKSGEGRVPVGASDNPITGCPKNVRENQRLSVASQ